MTNASTAGGREPFDVRAWVRAAGEGDAARVESWLAAGADVNAALESGETALIRATSKGRLEVVRRLLAAGADPDAEREDGFTALSVAVFFGHADIVRALLAGGADPTAKGRLGATVEKWALFSGHGEIVELLKNHGPTGAQSSAEDKAGKAGAPAFFPAEGTFSPVVPLSELDESASSGSVRGAKALDESPARVVVRDGEPESKEQEAVTLVRARVRPSRASLPARGVGTQVSRQGWPLTLVLLVLSLAAGAVAGTYLMRSKWALASETPPASAEEAAAAASNEASNPAPEPQPTAATAEPQPPPTTTRPAEPTSPAAPPETASAAPAAEADSKTKKTDGAKSSARESRDAATESRRAPASEPASRNKASASVKAARPSTPAAGEKTGGARPGASATDRGAQSTRARLITATPRAVSPPVFSPTPANKSEKRKVIPWP